MRPQPELTTERGITRRAVLWLGLRCDVRCKFCYDELVPTAEKGWLPLAEATRRLDRFATRYNNEFVDLMGGEPTLYPHLEPLLSHARQARLLPTLITHGMHLADQDRLRRYVAAGLHDVLISIHGVGGTARAIHGRGRDNYAKQLAALRNLNDLDVPIRFNVTLIRDNLGQLEAIADLAVEHRARVVNFLTFNPYFEWSADPQVPFQAKHSEIVVPLARALDRLTAGNVEANVRYMPICQLPGREHHVYTGHQLPYDGHEWDYNSWYDLDAPARPTPQWYRQASLRQQQRHHYQHPAACGSCALRAICDGFHEQYLARWGDGEARSYDGPAVNDPTVHIARQLKWQYPPRTAAGTHDQGGAGAVAGVNGPDVDGRAGYRLPR